MEKILTDQHELGEEIERIVRNYRKDSSERKTSSYLHQKKDDLNDHWQQFKSNNIELSKWATEFGEVDYFKSDYFGAVQSIVTNTMDDIQKIQDLLERAATVAGSSKEKAIKAVKEPSATLGHSLRCEAIMMTTLRHLLQRTEDRLNTDQPLEFKKAQLDAINRQWEAIRTKHLQIIQTEQIPVDYDVKDFIEIESWVENVQLRLMESTSSIASPVVYAAQANIKLPRIQLPKFDGNYLSWQEFHDLFTQLIDNNNLAPAQKLWFLKTNLTGEAEGLIRHLPVCDKNYVPAWNLIKKRYQNKRLLVNAILNKLTSQSGITNDIPNGVKALHDTTQECLRGLNALDIQVEQWDPILVFILLKKLDRATHMLFEQCLHTPREIPTVATFLQFLEQRFQSLEALGLKTNRGTERSTTSNKTALTANKTTGVSCQICKGNHSINQCDIFLKMDIPARKNLIAKRQLCFNCLKAGHSVKNCNSRSCLKCDKRHNTMLHQEIKPEEAKANNAKQALTMHQVGDEENSYVFLGTALIDLQSATGDYITARALIDSGSQLSLITEKLFKRLGCKGTLQRQEISGVGNRSQQTTRRVNLQLKSRTSNFNVHCEVFVLKEITSQHPARHVNVSQWKIPKDIPLADPNFNMPKNVDVLLGAELFCSLIQPERITLGPHLPCLQNTVLGWVIFGKMRNTTREDNYCGVTRDLDEQLEQFWQLEEMQTTNSPQDSECEQFFATTTCRNDEGRYTVRLPFAEPPTCLGESRQIALQRLNGLQRKFARNPDLREEYSRFITEYLQLGHLELVSTIDHSMPHYYLPHHCVLRPESSTTKLRVVFDGSAKTTTNKSLNDILHTGPTIQEGLFNILVRSRCHKYLILGDIKKMFRQVLIHPDDRNFQLILWLDRIGDELKTYRLKTVTYGTRSAPYLAIRTLKQLAQDESASLPLAAEVMQRDFYVDDLLTGADNLQEAIELQKQLDEILKKGGFHMHKCCSNSPKIMSMIPAEDRVNEFDITKLESEKVVKALGLTWNPSTDEYNIKVSIKSNERQITKRIVLSEMSGLFDPLGLVNPVIVLAKIFMQQLWELKIDWDTPLPDEIQHKWLTYRRQLPILSSVKIPRKTKVFGNTSSIQLHGFSDASERAYGACIYMRSEDKNGRGTTFLMCSKSRVAPSKKITIARLELCAAQLLANLMNKVKSSLHITVDKIFLWTDSMIVLHWISSPPSKFTTFVANRVASIQTASRDGIWQHVETTQNPADIVSRGMLPSQLLSTSLWFNGPEFLRHPIRIQPRINQNTMPMVIPEIRRERFVLSMARVNPNIIDTIRHNNNFQRLQEVLALIIRFGNNCRLPKEERVCRPKPSELMTSLRIIVRRMQEVDFVAELAQLRKDNTVATSSNLRALAPFLDDDNIIRVGGRIEKSNLPFNAKHPMVISPSNPLASLIFKELHQKYLHVGPQTLLYITRQTFWCINGKQLANQTVRNCIRCARTKPQLLKQIMGDLPAERIQQARPFKNVGIDYCGPIQIHFKIRGKRPAKAYIAVFICFSTKAVHLEVVSDLTTAAFIGSLKRFIARRGRPAKIFSDNATNFVGARSELKELAAIFHQPEEVQAIDTYCCNEGVQWCHIPPKSPHFGGLWEAAVKSAKFFLKRLLGDASLTFEELTTVMCQIEAVLNSRPLTPISSNANDLEALTPGHFLIGEPLSTLPDPTKEVTPTSLNTRWNLVKSLHAEFWRRWSKEYLNELHNRYKWQKPQPDIAIGTLVLLKEDNLPPLKWRMGRIVETIKGHDNYTRVVIVKTASGEFRRAINTVCPLPCDISTPELPSKESIEPVEEENKLPKLKILPVTSNYPALVKGVSAKRSAEASGVLSKRQKIGSLMQTLLCVLLVLPAFNRVEASSSDTAIEITPFKNNPGIFFEEVGRVKLTHNTWKIITYYDLSGYWTEYEGVSKHILNMVHLCAIQGKLLNVTQYCNTVVLQFQHLQLEIQQGNNLMYQHQRQLRKKRSPLNIIGSTAHLLFGILDEDFAEQYEEDISKVKNNENYLLGLLKNQTSLIEGTLHFFKRSTEEIQQQFNFIQSQIQQLTTTTRKLEEVSQIFGSIAIQTSLLLMHLQNTQNMLLQLMTNTFHGRINPLLLNADQLRSQIQLLREHLPADLVVPISSTSLLNLYSIATINTRTTRKNQLFDIRIPLLTAEQYQLLKLHPVPTNFHNNSVHVKTSSDYLSVTLSRDKYYPLSEFDRQNCKSFNMEYLICNQRHPIYTRQSDVSKCEISFLTHHASISADCQIETIPTKNHWIQLETDNSWIFVVQQKTIFDVVCGPRIYNKQIEGSGILKLDPDCVISQKAIIINGHTQISNTMNFPYTPIINLTDHLTNFTFVRDFVPETNFNETYTYMQQRLQQLSHDVRKQLAAELPERISSHDTHNYVVNYISLSMILIVSFYCLKQIIRTYNNNRRKITPSVEILSREFKVADDVK